MFFQPWSELGRIALVAAVLFVITVTLLRVVGQQTLAKMSGYAVIVTVSLGSILATVAVTPHSSRAASARTRSALLCENPALAR